MMKHFFAIITILAFFLQGYAQIDTCARETTFGISTLCLPVIEGLNEAYLEPKVKFAADATEMEGNTVLGFYLNDDTYKRRDSIGEFNFDDYCKIYGTNQIAMLDVEKPMLDEMSTMISSNFIQKNWDELVSESEEKLNMEIGVPTMVDSYNINDESFTLVMLAKYSATENKDESYTLAMTINGMLVKQRLVWMAYYLFYENEETFVELKSKNNKVVEAFIEAND